MKKETIKQLKRKGWSEDAIRDTENIIESRKLKDKSRTSAYSHKVLYWAVILVMVIGNFLIAFMLVPFLLVLDKLAVDVVVVIIGFAFGLFFNLLIWDIEHISPKHHLAAAVIIPVLAWINISVIVNISNAINTALNINKIRENPVTVSVLYVVAFMLPYLWSIFVKKKIELGYKEKITGSAETQKQFIEKY